MKPLKYCVFCSVDSVKENDENYKNIDEYTDDTIIAVSAW